MKKIYKAKVNKIEKVSSSSYFIEIECENPVFVEAGQFISIYCNGLTLRRPFSVYSNNDGKIGVVLRENKSTGQVQVLEKIQPKVINTHDSWNTLSIIDSDE